MNKDNYKEAINEIKASSKVKNETINRITTVKRKTRQKLVYTLSTVMIAAVIIISIAIPLKYRNTTEENQPTKIVADKGGLPRVENFENLCNILETKDTGYNYGKISEDLEDSVSIQESSKSSDTIEINTTSSDFSKTNVQVEGVDEADIVKTDGEYIYYVSEDKIVIVNAKDVSNLKIESELNYEDFNVYELYLDNNKLIVIGTRYDDTDYYYNNFTVAKQYNIQDKTNPILEREIEIKGYYNSSRMINGNVYLISNQYIDFFFDDEDINEDDVKPKYKDTIISEEQKCLGFDEIYYIPDSEERMYLNIASFDINNKEDANIQSFLGGGEEIYCSENNLYIANAKYEYKDYRIFGYYNNYDVNTYIYKFKLDGTNVEYVAIGNVPGYVINQFAMDENDGYFRIATTDYNGNKTDNNLYVLDENMNIVGKIENLAKDERIYSVRFMQNRAYMVTFVETDPLFVIDLTDPTNPIVLGELKIPGFSTYLHPYDDTHIIGFGEETTTNKYGRVTTNGIKMAMFDVTDPSNPKEMFKTTIGTAGTYSELLNNHKALLFSKEKNLMAFPITISEDASNYKYNLRFQGAMIYNIDLVNGFILKGMISHKETEEGYMDYDYSKNVERIIYIGNNAFTLSKGLIKVTDIETMDTIGSLEIETPEYTNRLKLVEVME